MTNKTMAIWQFVPVEPTDEMVGRAVGAGTSQGEIVVVYRNTNGRLFFRQPGDFDARMKLVTPGAAS